MRICSFLPLVVAATLAACLPVTSRTPVGSTVAAKDDPQLAGAWQGETSDKQGTVFLSFLRMQNGGTTAVLVGTPKPGADDNTGFYGSYAAQPAILGRNRFLNVRELMENGAPAKGPLADNTVPLLYTIKDGRLTLWLIDEGAVKAAIAKGKIAGEIGSGTYGDVPLTAKSAQLDAFFATDQARALFTNPFLVLDRIK